MKKPLLTTYLCRKNPLFFHFIVVPALLPSPPHLLPVPFLSCLLALRPVLLSFPLPFPTRGHSPFPHLPTSLPSTPSPSPYHPLMLYYTIPSHSIFHSVLLYISFPETAGRESERKCIYVSNHIDSVVGKEQKKKTKTNGDPFFIFHFIFFIRTFFWGNGKWSFGGFCFFAFVCFCFVCIVFCFIFGKMI